MIAFINIFHTLCYSVKRITVRYVYLVEPAVIQEILEERKKCERKTTAAEGTTGEIKERG